MSVTCASSSSSNSSCCNGPGPHPWLSLKSNDACLSQRWSPSTASRAIHRTFSSLWRQHNAAATDGYLKALEKHLLPPDDDQPLCQAATSPD